MSTSSTVHLAVRYVTSLRPNSSSRINERLAAIAEDKLRGEEQEDEEDEEFVGVKAGERGGDEEMSL